MFHAQHGSTKQPLLRGNVLAQFRHGGTKFLIYLHDVQSIGHTHILQIALLLEIYWLAALHQHRLVVEVVDVSSIVAVIFHIDGVVERWQKAHVGHLQTIVLQQGCQHLTLGGLVPLLAVVLIDDMLLLAFSLHTDAEAVLPHALAQLVLHDEGLTEEGLVAAQHHALLVEALQTVEVELSLQIARLVHPAADALLEGTLLLYQTDGIDTFVHTDGVLPVVAGTGIFRLVHDAHRLRRAHVAQHDLLLDGTNLHTGSIDGVAALLDAIAAEVAAGRAGIAHDHGKVARLIAVHRHASPRLRTVRNIILRIFGGAIRLGVCIDAEHGVVARLARPHPVIGLTTILTHRLRNGEHQSHVLEVAVGCHIILVSLVERLHLDTQRRVLLADGFLPCVFQTVNDVSLLAHGLSFQQRHHTIRYVLLLNHKADEQVLVGQFLLVALGHKAVEHVVVLYGGMAANGVETAMVIGEDQSFGTNHNT